MAQIGYYDDMNYLDFNLLNNIKTVTTRILAGANDSQEITLSFKFPSKLYVEGCNILSTIINFSVYMPANTAIYYKDTLVVNNTSNKTVNKSAYVDCNIRNIYLYDLYNVDSIFNITLKFVNNNKNIKNSASIILNNSSVKVRYATNYYPLQKIIIPNEISIKVGEVKYVEIKTIPENYTIPKPIYTNSTSIIGKVLLKSSDPLKVDVINNADPILGTIIVGISSGQANLIVTESYGIEISNKICNIIINDNKN